MNAHLTILLCSMTFFLCSCATYHAFMLDPKHNSDLKNIVEDAIDESAKPTPKLPLPALSPVAEVHNV